MHRRLKTKITIAAAIPRDVFLKLPEEKIKELYAKNYINFNYDGTEDETPFYINTSDIKTSIENSNREYVYYTHFIRSLETVTHNSISVYSSGIPLDYLNAAKDAIISELHELGIYGFNPELFISLSSNRSYNFN